VTVTNLLVQKVFVGAPPLKLFSTGFPFWDNEELKVYVRNTAAGTSVEQVLDTDFVITSHVAGSSGVIDTTIRPLGDVTAAETIHLIRVSNQDQQIDLTPAVDVPTAAIEQALDRQTMRLQESKDRFDSRAITIPLQDMDTAGNYPAMALPGKVARGVTGAYLAFNSSGEPVIATASVPVASTSAFGDAWILLGTQQLARNNIDAVYNRDEASMLALEASSESGDPAVAPATFTTGMFYTTNERRLWYSNASTWTEMVIGQHAHSALPSPATNGRLFLDTDQLMLKRDNTSTLAPIEGPWIRGSIGGGKLTWTNANTLAYAATEARCVLGTTGAKNARIAAGNKLTNATFATGSGNGGVAAGAHAMSTNTVHYVFLCESNAGVSDIGIDSSIVGSNILADGNFGALRENIRRIGSFMTAGTAVMLAFFDYGEGHYSLLVPLAAANTSVTTDYRSGVDVVLASTPPNMLVDIQLSPISLLNEGVLMETAQTSASPASPIPGLDFNAGEDKHFRRQIQTDGSSRIHWRVTTDTQSGLDVALYGWFDRRDKDV